MICHNYYYDIITAITYLVSTYLVKKSKEITM